MPIYEFRCPNGHVFEVLQWMDDPPPEKCEVCCESPVQRVLLPVAVHFKGSGFYSTDYGRSRKRGGSKESSDGGSSSEKSSESKTEKAASSD